jgi:hypothetical protein
MGQSNCLIAKKRVELVNLYRYSTHSSSSDWLKAFRKRNEGGKLSLAPNLLLTWVSCPSWSPVTGFFFPYVTKQGVPVPSLPDFTDNFILLLNRQPLFSIIFVIPTRYHPKKNDNFFVLLVLDVGYSWNKDPLGSALWVGTYFRNASLWRWYPTYTPTTHKAWENTWIKKLN